MNLGFQNLHSIHQPLTYSFLLPFSLIKYQVTPAGYNELKVDADCNIDSFDITLLLCLRFA